MEKNLFSNIIFKAWKDKEFKEELIRNPKKVLTDQGIEIPENVDVTIYEETDNESFFVIPQAPTGELSEEELEAIAGGSLTDFVRDVLQQASDQHGGLDNAWRAMTKRWWG